jgi:vacuolar-type H+-ATPase subunit I/STV1
MKRKLISLASILVFLAAAWVLLAQTEAPKPPQPQRERPAAAPEARRRGMSAEEQLKAIATIEAELAKVKSGVQSLPASREAWQSLSEEERSKMREKREGQRQSLGVIDEQLAKLAGSRQLTQEHEEFIAKLKAIQTLAVKENAKETSASVEKLIAEQQKKFEDRMNKLGLQPTSGGQRPTSGQ